MCFLFVCFLGFFFCFGFFFGGGGRGVVVGGFVGASLLLLCLFDFLVCRFMTRALLKFELSVRVVLGSDFFFYK